MINYKFKTMIKENVKSYKVIPIGKRILLKPVEVVEETVETTTNPKSIKTTEVVEFSAEDELAKLKEENEKLKTELAAQPASAPLDTNKFSSDRKPVSRAEYNKMTRREKFLHDLNK